MYINSIIYILNVLIFSFCERNLIKGIDLLILELQGSEVEILSVLSKLKNKLRSIIYEYDSSMKPADSIVSLIF